MFRAVLAAVVITGEQDGVRHVLAQAAGNLDVLDEPDHERVRVSVLSHRNRRSRFASTISAFSETTRTMALLTVTKATGS